MARKAVLTDKKINEINYNLQKSYIYLRKALKQIEKVNPKFEEFAYECDAFYLIGARTYLWDCLVSIDINGKPYWRKLTKNDIMFVESDNDRKEYKNKHFGG